MTKQIPKSSNYFFQHITDLLSGGNRTAIPKDVLEKEGFDLKKLNQFFFTQQGPYGLIHFLGLKNRTI